MCAGSAGGQDDSRSGDGRGGKWDGDHCGVFAVTVVATVVDVRLLDMAAILTMVALSMALAATIVIVVEAMGQRKAAGAEQRDGNEHATDEFPPPVPPSARDGR